MLHADTPAIVLAPMDGLSDAPMRAAQGESGAFTFAVSEFIRVNDQIPPKRVFLRDVPELVSGGRTITGLPVEVQILGGDPMRMAQAAVVACQAGAIGVDINFGCPAPTVNRHDGGATLLKYPHRVRDIVTAVRKAVPENIPVSAKLRLGWESMDDIFENAAMAAEGGASWITIHGRTKQQGYRPPADWTRIGRVREQLSIPVVANGDIWTIDDFRRCQDQTGCIHFMLGRGALARPNLSWDCAEELGISPTNREPMSQDWMSLLLRLLDLTEQIREVPESHVLCRAKQWLNIARLHGGFAHFDAIKRTNTLGDLLNTLASCLADTTRCNLNDAQLQPALVTPCLTE